MSLNTGAIWDVPRRAQGRGLPAARKMRGAPRAIAGLNLDGRPRGGVRRPAASLAGMSLIMLTAPARDAFQGLRSCGLVQSQVAKRDDSDQTLIAVHHRQSPDL